MNRSPTVPHPALLSREAGRNSGTPWQVGEADENFLGYWWCEHYRRMDEAVYQPARRHPWWRRARRRSPPRAALSGEALSAKKARRGEELFWGRHRWWGTATGLTPNLRRFSRRLNASRVWFQSTALDSHAVVREYSVNSTDTSTSRRCCRRFHIEMKLRLAGTR